LAVAGHGRVKGLDWSMAQGKVDVAFGKEKPEDQPESQTVSSGASASTSGAGTSKGAGLNDRDW
jgi:hypothetical protein